LLTRRQILLGLLSGSGLALCAGPSGFLHQAGAADTLRIVSIDWAAAEAMLSLGIVPVGLSDTSFYRKRMASPVLPDTVADVGPFWEINLEALAELRPDFIIATDYNMVMTPRIADVARVELVPSISWPSIFSTAWPNCAACRVPPQMRLRKWPRTALPRRGQSLPGITILSGLCCPILAGAR
jgi:iron complex transport system substrate-binding protein